METKITCQEVLIMQHSRFFSKELEDRNEEAESQKLSPTERLAEACWNGLISVALPEIMSPLSLTGVNEADEFLELRFSEPYQNPEKEFSINPYAFMRTIHYN